MGETLAETRLEVSAQRAEVERTAEQLQARVRRALDIRAKIRENPVVVGGLARGLPFRPGGGGRDGLQHRDAQGAEGRRIPRPAVVGCGPGDQHGRDQDVRTRLVQDVDDWLFSCSPKVFCCHSSVGSLHWLLSHLAFIS